MINSQKNLITLRVIEKKNINSLAALQQVTVAEVVKGTEEYKEGYIVMASIEGGSPTNNILITVPSSDIMAVVGSSLSEYS